MVVPRFVPLEYEEYVEKYASQYQVEPSLVYAVIFCESGYDPQAVSHAGSKGLMQISDDTAVWAAQQIEGMDAENLNVMDPDKISRSAVGICIGSMINSMEIPRLVWRHIMLDTIKLPSGWQMRKKVQMV